MRLQGLLPANLLHHLSCMLKQPSFLQAPPTHHAVPGVSPVPVEVGQVTVLVPPGAAVGQGAVTQGNVIIRVNGGPGSALVVGHGIACRMTTKVGVCVGKEGGEGGGVGGA